MSTLEPASVRSRLRTELRAAMTRRDRIAADALRSTLSAIDNAEAVPAAPDTSQPAEGPIAGAARGVGAADVPRRVLTEDEIRKIVAAEAAEKRSAAEEYEALSRFGDAERLRSQAQLLEAQLR